MPSQPPLCGACKGCAERPEGVPELTLTPRPEGALSSSDSDEDEDEDPSSIIASSSSAVTASMPTSPSAPASPTVWPAFSPSAGRDTPRMLARSRIFSQYSISRRKYSSHSSGLSVMTRSERCMSTRAAAMLRFDSNSHFAALIHSPAASRVACNPW